MHDLRYNSTELYSKQKCRISQWNCLFSFQKYLKKHIKVHNFCHLWVIPPSFFFQAEFFFFLQKLNKYIRCERVFL